VFAAAADVATDDEHDPEGTTIAFERAQVTALLERARRRVADLDDALLRLEAGDYGLCESCGGGIAPERLEARPSARTCMACAT
jgi:DnaK suppressor protein